MGLSVAFRGWQQAFFNEHAGCRLYIPFFKHLTGLKGQFKLLGLLRGFRLGGITFT